MSTNDEAAAVSIGTAAARLGLGQATVRALVDEGKLDAYRTPGGHRRVTVASIDALLERARARIDAPPTA